MTGDKDPAEATTIIRPARRRPRVLRRVGAVLAGIATIFVLSLGTDALLHASGVFPPWGEPMGEGLFALALAYRIVYGVAGGYVTARLAPTRPMWHAMALGVAGVVLSTAGAVATWDAGPAFGPRWFLIALILIAIPCAWLGGRLHERRR